MNRNTLVVLFYVVLVGLGTAAVAYIMGVVGALINPM